MPIQGSQPVQSFPPDWPKGLFVPKSHPPGSEFIVEDVFKEHSKKLQALTFVAGWYILGPKDLHRRYHYHLLVGTVPQELHKFRIGFFHLNSLQVPHFHTTHQPNYTCSRAGVQVSLSSRRLPHRKFGLLCTCIHLSPLARIYTCPYACDPVSSHVALPHLSSQQLPAPRLVTDCQVSPFSVCSLWIGHPSCLFS